MGRRATKTTADFGVEAVELLDYVRAGSPRASDYLGVHEDVSCACCGAAISHVFWSNVGPLGGDCAATLTGDNATRAAIRRKLETVLEKARIRRPRCYIVRGADVVARMVSDYSDRLFEKTIATMKTRALARMIACAAADQVALDGCMCPVLDADGKEIM
jgi:hypothetical protein